MIDMICNYFLSLTDLTWPRDGKVKRVDAEVSDQGGLQGPHGCGDGDEEPRTGPGLSHRLHCKPQRGRSPQNIAGEFWL